LAAVSVEGLTKTFTGKTATKVIKELDIEIQDGEFVVLLGPSGCGKTTALRCLAGLEVPSAGKISLGGQTVFDAARHVNLPPNRRSIGMVFQSYALWPHMTVRQNIAYPLRARGLKQKIKVGWVEDIARLVDCEPLLDRYPAQLSGGQQQRVALARGLVARPDLILLDEPLSNLDARLRDSVRTQLHELHSRLGFTAVFVTHDQSEALALGDRLAIMREGAIEQFDTPPEIFDRPATDYVAAFVGMSNLLVCERREGGWICAGQRLEGESLAAPGELDREAVRLRLRPEDLHLGPTAGPPAAGPPAAGPPAAGPPAAGTPAAGSPAGGTIRLPARVEAAEYGGRHVTAVVAVGDTRLQARVPAGGRDGWARRLSAGQWVRAGFRAGDARFYDESGRSVSPAPRPHQRVEA
jgi:iron(III) transport system ATP-binding protein